METPNCQEHKSIKAGVYDRIECEKICPRPKAWFMTRECAVWSLWLVSVVVGALAVAVTLFVMPHRQYALYEATHDNVLTLIVDASPFLWIAVFGLMVCVAVYNLRHTKRGYRYPLWQILASSMVLSLAGGSALHLFGFGYSVDHLLGSHMPLYVSQEKIERSLWQAPHEGRLMGVQVDAVTLPSSTIVFSDVAGDSWQVDVTDLSPQERQLLESRTTVRLIGLVKDETLQLFHSCGAFPWMLDKPMSREALETARENFKIRLMEHQHHAEKAVHRLREVSPTSTYSVADADNPCASIALVRRLAAPNPES